MNLGFVRTAAEFGKGPMQHFEIYKFDRKIGTGMEHEGDVCVDLRSAMALSNMF